MVLKHKDVVLNTSMKLLHLPPVSQLKLKPPPYEKSAKVSVFL